MLEITIPEITVGEIWHPTMQLRNVERSLMGMDYVWSVFIVLQQAYASNLGNKQWRDVPIEDEF